MSVKSKSREVQRLGERLNNPDLVLRGDKVVQILRKRYALPPILTFRDTSAAKLRTAGNHVGFTTNHECLKPIREPSDIYRMLNLYEDAEGVARSVADGQHRDIVGGLWDEIGRLQFDFLRANGLTRKSRLIDIGCGCLRGGVHFISYLDDAMYFGVDSNESLLNVGYDVELKSVGLDKKLPRDQLVCNSEFDFGSFPADFEFAIAHSLFTHLPQNHIRLCLSRLAEKMTEGGRFFATFFLVPESHPYGEPFRHPEGVTSFDAKDPYHYRYSNMESLCERLPWLARLHGGWGHPRGQQMIDFLRIRDAVENVNSEQDDERFQDFESAGRLPAGANHYRAYVGPPDRFDFMSATQFALLFALGLRDWHRVLDFGCGSLRLGRLLIPFLRPERYFGIDPNRWLISDGVDRELGRSILRLKRPRFSYNADFDCMVFGEGLTFDFVVAQSILTHCGEDLMERLTREAASVLSQSGKFVFSIVEHDDPLHSPNVGGWVYPHCVAYGTRRVKEACARAGLQSRRLPWFHPGAVWYMAARQEASLPADREMALLRGAVLFDPQFVGSRND